MKPFKEIRREARDTLAKMTGKTSLFLAPILLAILSLWLVAKEAYDSVQSVYGVTAAHGDSSLLTLVLRIFSAFFIVSAVITLREIYAGKRKAANFSDSSRSFGINYLLPLVALGLYQTLILFTWSLLLLPGIYLLSFSLAAYEFYGVFSWSMVLVALILVVLGMAVFINRSYAYSQTIYVLLDQLQEGTYQGSQFVLATSVQIMKGVKFRFFLFKLCFIGWDFLTGLTFGLLYFYVLPYKTMAELLFYEDLKSKQAIGRMIEGQAEKTPRFVKPLPETIETKDTEIPRD